jgi:hypothetical protein
MSIRDEIRAHLGSKLFYLPSRFPVGNSTRELIVSEGVLDVVTPSSSSYWVETRHAELRAYLHAFVDNEEIGVSEKPFTKRGDTFLARVHPIEQDVWDIRVIEPSPGIRCFGCFGDRDLFVALTWNYRENIEETANGFELEARECRSVWSSLFTLPPRTGRIDVHLSGNYFASR